MASAARKFKMIRRTGRAEHHAIKSVMILKLPQQLQAKPLLIKAQHSFKLVDRLRAGDVRLTLIKDGDHRLSRDRDLALLAQTVAELSGDASSAASPTR